MSNEASTGEQVADDKPEGTEEAVTADAVGTANTTERSATPAARDTVADGGGEDDTDGDDEDLDPLEEEGDVAADYLEELLDIADLDGDIDTFSEGGRAHVSIVTEGDVLVGKDGEVLEALQELARLAVMTETGRRSRLMLDVAGHRDRRRRELQDLAADAIQEAKDAGESVRLAPMNPFERKIVHDAVAEAGLSSESEGEEPRRRVVVIPRS